jgi:hypothetical protein
LSRSPLGWGPLEWGPLKWGPLSGVMHEWGPALVGACLSGSPLLVGPYTYIKRPLEWGTTLSGSPLSGGPPCVGGTFGEDPFE